MHHRLARAVVSFSVSLSPGDLGRIRTFCGVVFHVVCLFFPVLRRSVQDSGEEGGKEGSSPPPFDI